MKKEIDYNQKIKKMKAWFSVIIVMLILIGAYLYTSAYSEGYNKSYNECVEVQQKIIYDISENHYNNCINNLCSELGGCEDEARLSANSDMCLFIITGEKE